MCGIAGYIKGNNSHFSHKELDIFNTLCILNETRGIDSTGFMSCNNNLDSIHYKTALSHSEAMKRESPNLKKFFDESERFLIGHTRAATIGKVNKENAHPFVHGDFTGLHNGTIKGIFPHKEDFETDSEALIYNINHFGSVSQGIAKSYTWHCAFATVIYNSKTKELTFARNKDRPLHFCYYKNDLLFASEEWMLWAIADKFHLNVEKVTLLNDHTEAIVKIDQKKKRTRKWNNICRKSAWKPTSRVANRNYHQTYSKHNEFEKEYYNRLKQINSQEEEHKVINLPVQPTQQQNSSKVKKTNEDSLVSGDNYNDLFYNTVNADVDIEEKTLTVEDLFDSSSEHSALILHQLRQRNNLTNAEFWNCVLEYIKQFSHSIFSCYIKNSLISKIDKDVLLHRGCMNCGNTPLEGNFEKIFWFSEQEYICPDCWGQTHILELVYEELGL